MSELQIRPNRYPQSHAPMDMGMPNHLPSMPNEQNNIANANNVAANKGNIFINAATPLMTLMNQIKHSQTPPDVTKLRMQIINEIKLFEQKLLQSNLNPRQVMAARYCLCTAIDEAVLSTSWGTQSAWVQQSLLVMFHKEAYGGERFYVILESMIKDPRTNIDFIELIYMLLSLGYEGKFFDNDKMIREEIRSRVFMRIRQLRGKVTRSLSGHWKDIKPIEDSQIKKKRIKRLIIGTLGLLLAMNIVFNILVYNGASHLYSRLKTIGTESPNTTYEDLIDRTVVPAGYK